MLTFVCPNYDCRSPRITLMGTPKVPLANVVNLRVLCLDCGMEHLLQIEHGKQSGLTAAWIAHEEPAL